MLERQPFGGRGSHTHYPLSVRDAVCMLLSYLSANCEIISGEINASCHLSVKKKALKCNCLLLLGHQLVIRKHRGLCVSVFLILNKLVTVDESGHTHPLPGDASGGVKGCGFERRAMDMRMHHTMEMDEGAGEPAAQPIKVEF